MLRGRGGQPERRAWPLTTCLEGPVVLLRTGSPAVEESRPGRRCPDLPSTSSQGDSFATRSGFSWCCRCCVPSRAHLCLPTRAHPKEDTGLLSASTVGARWVCSSFPKRPGTSSTSSPSRSHEAGPRGASSFLPSKSQCCHKHGLCCRVLGSGSEAVTGLNYSSVPQGGCSPAPS